MSEWTYLDDGLYARFDGWSIILRANDPRNENSPTVYLDYITYSRLVQFAEKPEVFDLELTMKPKYTKRVKTNEQ